MSSSQPCCANCAKKSKQDPQYLIIPANFHPENWNVPTGDVGLLRSILHLDTTMQHSMARYDHDDHPDPFDDTYKNVRMTRERIEKQIKENPDSYEIINFGKVSALARKDHEELIRKILMEIREDFFTEDRFFGKKVGLHNIIYGKNEVSHNCWIFLKEDFILFVTENKEKIEEFFLKQSE